MLAYLTALPNDAGQSPGSIARERNGSMKKGSPLLTWYAHNDNLLVLELGTGIVVSWFAASSRIIVGDGCPAGS